MTPLPKDVEVALSILQIVGLLLPIIFISLQPYYEPLAKKAVQNSATKNTWVNIGGEQVELEKEVVDVAPTIVRWGLLIVGLFALSVFLAVIRVLFWVSDSWLISLSLICLGLGVIGLALLFYLVRKEFVSVLHGV